MQKKDYQKLRECPFYGGEAEIRNESFCSFVKCKNCGAECGMVQVSAEYCAIDKSIEAWNSRTKNKEV